MNCKSFARLIRVASMAVSFLCLASSAYSATAKTVTDLDQGWQFRQLSGENLKNEWMPARVPGDVHLDLLANKLIPDPFYRDNEAKLQWIESASWEYRLPFIVTEKQMAAQHRDLVFDGLDAACDVFLNDKLILSANNMHRQWRVDVSDRLHGGANELRVVFPSPSKAAHQVAVKDPWDAKTHVADQEYIRKAAYEYGWDWGPRFVTSGIWRPVHLETWNDERISDFFIEQKHVTASVANLNAQVSIEAAKDGKAELTLTYANAVAPISIHRDVFLSAGHNVVDVAIQIEKPNLWFPAGYGGQPLYAFTARLSDSTGVQDERSLRTGLRSIVLRRDLDRWGRSFEFVVNGIPVFAKGADLIPFDSFPSRVTAAEERQILESARDANMNMIRVWGGGYYGSDEFYSICDELGLMVWQDFMFGNHWQPGSYDFKLEIKAEAEEVVTELRNHPSIVLWCGNNETESAFNWSGEAKLPPEVRFQMWQDYVTEFSGILPRAVERLSPETPYWPSSPSADYETLSDTFVSGDAHDWSVWHGRVPFTEYEKHHFRFVSEYGFQSFPELRTIKDFTLPADRTSIFTPVMLAHQKNNEGNSIIQDYIAKEYPEPKDFESFLYVSQVVQAEGIKIGAEHFRRSRPETMGSIFWQLNDCWPVASWSSIDSEGRWKALQYFARRFYAPILVSPHLEDGAVKTYIVSDKTAEQAVKLHLSLMDFEGKVLLEETKGIIVSPLDSKVYEDWPLTKLLAAAGKDAAGQVFVNAEIESEGKILSQNLTYLVPTRDVSLPAAPLSATLTGSGGVYELRVSSPVLARSVYVSFGDLDAVVSDNYFDLLPNRSVALTIRSAKPLDELRAAIKVISLRDAFQTESGASGSVASKK